MKKLLQNRFNFGCSCCALQAPKKSFKIGVILPLTGDWRELRGESVDAMRSCLKAAELGKQNTKLEYKLFFEATRERCAIR